MKPDTELLNGAIDIKLCSLHQVFLNKKVLLSEVDAVSAPLTLVAVLGIRGPCMSFSLDSSTRSCFFSRICLARTRISCISSSSLSSSESYSPARSFSSSSLSRYSNFYKRQQLIFQRKGITERHLCFNHEGTSWPIDFFFSVSRSIGGQLQLIKEKKVNSPSWCQDQCNQQCCDPPTPQGSYPASHSHSSDPSILKK